jgi:hypothetical protein
MIDYVQNGQLVVEGPDGKAATAIATQLSTGQAKLANINGKQVTDFTALYEWTS